MYLLDSLTGLHIHPRPSHPKVDDTHDAGRCRLRRHENVVGRQIAVDSTGAKLNFRSSTALEAQVTCNGRLGLSQALLKFVTIHMM